jgi:hypothetical protein
MGARGDGYRDRALDCEAKAAAETDDKSRRRLLELAKRWRELAKQLDMMDEDAG